MTVSIDNSCVASDFACSAAPHIDPSALWRLGFARSRLSAGTRPAASPRHSLYPYVSFAWALLTHSYFVQSQALALSPLTLLYKH